MNYTLLILGNTGKHVLNYEQSNSSLEFVAHAIYNELKLYNNIEIGIVDCRALLKFIPEVDVILFIGYYDQWKNLSKNNFEIIKKYIRYKKIITLLEFSLIGSDWSFCFVPSVSDTPKSTLIRAPCVKKLYVNKTKEKSICVDHYWLKYLDTENDWTHKIEDWLMDRKDEYKIYRIIRFKDEEKNIKSYEIPIFYSNFFEYLESTNTIQNYIITHKESYAYGIIDMIARGIRVLTPPQFVKKDIIDYFELPTFTDKNSFLNILDEPINESLWKGKINKCNDYSLIAKEIDERIKLLL
jgi:hypothetical protein